jgi:hypothetical protein
MRKIIGALVLALLAAPETVLAQPTLWTDPTGSFQLTLPDGWETFETAPADILNVGPRRAARSGAPGCKVTIARPSLPQVTQAAANAFVRNSYSQTNLLSMMSDRRPHVVQYSSDLIGGVQVATLVVDIRTIPGEEPRIYQRRFALILRDGEARAFHFHCEMDLRADAADGRNMESLLGSLSFIQKASP